MKITFKKFGTEITKEFDSKMDLIEFVIFSGIKDEDLVSIDLGDGEITGGINGLAIHALNVIKETREAMAAEDEEDDEDNWDNEDEDCGCDCDCDSCKCNCDCDDTYIPKHASVDDLDKFIFNN